MKTRKTFKDLNKDEKYKLCQILEACENTADFLQVIIENFDLENNKPGMITKKILASSMINTVLPMINPNTLNNE